MKFLLAYAATLTTITALTQQERLNMKSNRIVFWVVGAVAGLSVVTQASVVDDFESYLLGSNLHGQNGWKGWDNVEASGGYASSDYAASGSQSVKVSAGSDLVRVFDGLDSGQYTVNLKQYIPSSTPSSGKNYVILLNRYEDGAGLDDWSVQVLNDLATGEVVSDLGGFATLPLIKDRWVDYRFDIDLTANLVSEYYDGELLSTHVWWDAVRAPDGYLKITALDLYSDQAGAVYYDNLNVQPIPEPTTIAFLGLGALALVLSRRMR